MGLKNCVAHIGLHLCDWNLRLGLLRVTCWRLICWDVDEECLVF
jgi:hypothetical protein